MKYKYLYKNEYFYTFFYKILAKYSKKKDHFFKFSRGSMPPNPPNKRVAMQISPLSKNILNPPEWNPRYATACLFVCLM